MNIWPENTPIIDDKGRVAAYLACDIEVQGTHYNWTWYNPRNQTELAQGPQFYDDESRVPVNQGTLSAAFQRGEYLVLNCSLRGDTSGAFMGNRMFREVPQGKWGDKFAAINLLRDDLGRIGVESDQMDYLAEMYKRRAKD